MNNFIKNLISGNGTTPPDECLSALRCCFEHAINVEWFDKGDWYEAIFYNDNMEHIALFSAQGTLLEYKQFLPDGFLPEILKTTAEARGEIMNAVLINKGHKIEYEIIVRDSLLKRYSLTLSDTGKLLEEKLL